MVGLSCEASWTYDDDPERLDQRDTPCGGEEGPRPTTRPAAAGRGARSSATPRLRPRPPSSRFSTRATTRPSGPTAEPQSSMVGGRVVGRHPSRLVGFGRGEACFRSGQARPM